MGEAATPLPSQRYRQAHCLDCTQRERLSLCNLKKECFLCYCGDMSTGDFLLLIVTVACGVLCSVGGGLMVAGSNEHRRAARIAFYLGGALFWFAGVIGSYNIMGQPIAFRLMIAGIVGAASAIFTVWMLTLTSSAQTPLPPNGINGSVTGLEIVENGQGGPAVDIESHGSPNGSSVGYEQNVHGMPGQSVTGTRVIQTGPGTGMRVIQTGPGVGFRSTVTIGPNSN
jgi:hypothetical protein